MNLSSFGRAYTETELEGPVLSITLLKQESQAAVVFGTSYGFIGNRVWVDNGARGDFRVVYTTSRSIRVVQVRLFLSCCCHCSCCDFSTIVYTNTYNISVGK